MFSNSVKIECVLWYSDSKSPTKVRRKFKAKYGRNKKKSYSSRMEHHLTGAHSLDIGLMRNFLTAGSAGEVLMIPTLHGHRAMIIIIVVLLSNPNI